MTCYAPYTMIKSFNLKLSYKRKHWPRFFTTTTPTEKKLWSENKIVLWTKNLQSVTFKPYLSTIRAFKTKQFISLFVKWVSTFVLCFSKVCLSHWSQVGNELGLGTVQHSLWQTYTLSASCWWWGLNHRPLDYKVNIPPLHHCTGDSL